METNFRVERFLGSRADFLDPRQNPVPPALNAARIPVDELANRVYELPPPSRVIRILNVGPEAEQARVALQSMGRSAELGDFPDFGEDGRRRLWMPNEFLMSVLPELAPGRALDLGCGAGREAVALAACGWKVLAVDNLPDALDRGRDLESRYTEGQEPIDWQVRDLKKDFPFERFNLVTQFYFFDRAMLSEVIERIEEGGHLLLEAFTPRHEARFGKPRSDRTVGAEELASLVAELEIFRIEESETAERSTVRLWAGRK